MNDGLCAKIKTNKTTKTKPAQLIHKVAFKSIVWFRSSGIFDNLI